MPNFYFFKVYPSFFNFIENIESELIIICPYIKIDALKKILDKISNEIKVIVISKWSLFDLVFGSSDLEVYEYLKELNYKFYINNDIHLKVLLKDKKEIIVGSANITNSGLGFIENSNIEAISISHFDDKHLSDILKILKLSIQVDDELYNIISEHVKEFEKIKNSFKSELDKIKSYDKKIIRKKPKNILVADFPFCPSPQKFIESYLKNKFDIPEVKHDMSLFGLDENKNIKSLENNLKNAFLLSEAFAWQDSIIKDKILFGKYSEILHDSLMDHPKPYRKRVKELVDNMFSWTNFFSSKFEIKKHKHTISLCRI